MDEDTGTITWNHQLETILSQEGERALCYAWLHTQSQTKYTKLHTYMTLPTIVMSTIAGSTAIGSSTIFGGRQEIASYFVGGISISVGVLNTVLSYFGWSKKSESHRLCAIAYTKIHRFIMIELALPRSERMAARDMLKVMRDQLDRLQETSPQIPDSVIVDFKKKFADTTPEVSKPGITNGLDPIEVYLEDCTTPMISGFKVKISSDGRTPDSLQRLSSVHLPTESASDSNHT